MRDFVYPDFVAYLVMALTLAAVLIIIYSDRISDWLLEREERKEAEAKAKAAAKSEPKSA